MSNPPMPQTGYAENPVVDVHAASATMPRMIRGLHISRALYVAAKLGIADLLANVRAIPRTWPSVLKAHAPSLYHVLRLLGALDVFREQSSGHLALTPLGERLRTGLTLAMSRRCAALLRLAATKHRLPPFSSHSCS